MRTTIARHLKRLFRVAAWLARKALPAPALDLWRPVPLWHRQALGASLDGGEARQEPCGAGVSAASMRQRRAGVTRPLRVAPRSARDACCRAHRLRPECRKGTPVRCKPVASETRKGGLAPRNGAQRRGNRGAVMRRRSAQPAVRLRLTDMLAGGSEARESMNTTIGTCGSCGGPVQVPTAWYGVVPPTPTCARCGAVARENHGPVVPMQPPAKTRTGGGYVMSDKEQDALRRALNRSVKFAAG